MDHAPRTTSVEFGTNWVPLVPIRLNGVGPFTFLLETGALGFSVSPEVASRLGLSTDPAASRVLASIEIGGFRCDSVPVGLHDTSLATGLFGRPIGGYLGNLMLYALGVATTIDYPGSTLTLEGPPGPGKLRVSGGPVPPLLRGAVVTLRRPTAEAGSRVPVQISRGYTIMPVHVNGDGPHDFLLDTGAEPCVVCPELAASLGLPAGETATARGGWDNKPCHRSQVAEFRVGEAACRDLPVTVMDCADVSDLAGRCIEGYVGFPFLKEFAVTLDYRDAG